MRGVSEMTLLFDDIARADSRPARETESTYEFLNRHDSVFFQLVRNLLEDWFSHLPAEEIDTWKKSFQSGDDRVSQSAFWELYLHEIFLRMGCVAEIHPWSRPMIFGVVRKRRAR